MRAYLQSCITCPICGHTMHFNIGFVVSCENQKCRIFKKIFENPFVELKEIESKQ